MASTTWAVRSARPEDLSFVLALLERAELPVEGVADGFGPSYAVAESAGAVVGAAGVERLGPFGLLRSVVVAEPLRGTGLGRILVGDRLDWARSEGMETVYLLTTTAPGFFAGLGFKTIPRDVVPGSVRTSSEFSTLCPETATVMELSIV